MTSFGSVEWKKKSTQDQKIPLKFKRERIRIDDVRNLTSSSTTKAPILLGNKFSISGSIESQQWMPVSVGFAILRTWTTGVFIGADGEGGGRGLGL